jgi:Flp pilus assembly protein TadG
VEFALLVPVLVLLLGGILDFGFVFSQQIALNNAARDAARAGVVKPLVGNAKNCTEITSAARAGTAGAVGLDSTAVTVTVAPPNAAVSCSTPSTLPCTSSTTGQSLTVQVTYSSTPPFPLPFFSPISLKSRGVFQCEYS